MNNLAEKYEITDYWCEKCYWYPKKSDVQIDKSELNEEGEVDAPCIKCGHMNPVTFERLADLPEDKPFNDLMGAMGDVVEKILQELGSREFEEKMRNMPEYRPPLELVCNICGGRYTNYCRPCKETKPLRDSWGYRYE